MTNVFVCGWYSGHGNVGDNAFRPALRKVLGANLTFGDRIPWEINSKYDALVIGGGSFLDASIDSAVKVEDVEIPFGFVGVGVHNLHPKNIPWIDKAKVVATRNRCDLDDALMGWDLVYARDDLFPSPQTFLENEPPFKYSRPRLLVLPNGFYRPTEFCEGWRQAQLTAFEGNLRQIIGGFQHKGWVVNVQPMMATPGPVTEIQDDRLAGMRLMTGERISIGTQPLSEDELCAEIDRADLVISSRFHGCVLSAMAGVPFVGVGSHAKFEGYFEERGWKNYVPLEQLDQETFEVALRALPAPEEMCRDREEGRAWWDANSRTIRDALFT